MCSGIEPTAELSGAPYVQTALRATLGDFGPVFITLAMILFAFTTLLGNLYYVDKALAHIIGQVPSKTFNAVYYILASLVILLGAGLSADLLWNIADLTMGAMALINIPVLFILGKYAFRALNDYKKQRKAGLDPTFRAKDVGIDKSLDYWN
jgi:AGCS family alanine or glycine:cation symporter